jgi:hypothetical protein
MARTQEIEEPQVQAEPKPPYPEQKLDKPGIEAEMEFQSTLRRASSTLRRASSTLAGASSVSIVA